VIELRHHTKERLLHVLDRPLRVELALLIETALAPYHFLTIKI
jgi:hypothetical protein